jgi:hypothetical protein
VVGIFTAVGLGLVAGLIAGDASIGARPPSSRAILIGVSIALLIAGTSSMLRHVTSTMSPDWGNLAPASTYLPFISAAFGPLSVFFTQTLILLTALYGIHVNRRRTSIAWLVIGIAIAGASIETITSWLVIGVVTGVVLMLAYRLVFQHEPALLLVTTTALVILSATEEAVQHMYPSALAGSLTGAVIVAIAGWIWFRGTMEEL